MMKLSLVKAVGIFFIFILAGLLFLSGAGRAHAQATSSSTVWVTPDPGSDLAKLKKDIEARGGQIIALAPEGRLLVRYPSTAVQLAQVPGVKSAAPMAVPKDTVAAPEGRGLGERPPTPEEEARLNATPVTSVAPNSLSKQRAALQEVTLASSVDNSLSTYFPPIRNQGSLGSCAAFASTYYYNTFTQAKDENLNVSTGNNSLICSPLFTFNLLNGGAADIGLSVVDGMNLLNYSGSCSWESMPYSGDYLVWPTEASWIDAMKRRTQSAYSIGSWYNGATDSDILAIKQHLANGNICITRTDLFDNMYNTYPADTTGINSGVWFAPGGAYVGGHAMTVVGYDDNKSYYNGSTWKYGAFLIANSWGGSWGTFNSASTSCGYMWVSYDFFKEGSLSWQGVTRNVFGQVWYNSDRDNYRSRFYVAAGVNHAQRGMVLLRAGIGTDQTINWISNYILDFYGGIATAVNDTKRVVVDLTDGIPSVSFPNIKAFARMALDSTATGNGTLTNTTFYYDFDGNGTFDSVQANNTPITVTPGGATAVAMTSFTWSDTQLTSFGWSAIGSTQTANQPIAATITAKDTLGRTATSFTGTVNVTACASTTSTIGTATTTSDHPLWVFFKKTRSEHIYLQSELGPAASWTNLSFNVTSLPSRYLEGFKIRIKHVSATNFGSSPAWDTDGWTTVYSHDRTVTATGWMSFPFDTPFAYNGTDNVIIDFSINGTGWASPGYVASRSTSPEYRTIYAGGDSYPDPVTWTTAGQTPYRDAQLPIIKLGAAQAVPVTPSVTGNFTAGVWSGSFTLASPATGVWFTADDGAGHMGLSNGFQVDAPAGGSLTVTIGPSSAVSLGAMWRRSGQSTWHASGTTENAVPAGAYSVEFKQVPGWFVPPLQPVTITDGGSASASGNYDQMNIVWVDFAFGGTPYGLQASPYVILDSAVAAVTSGGTICLKPGTGNQALRITKPVRLESVGGTATIGR